jgi:hypothetical protein
MSTHLQRRLTVLLTAVVVAVAGWAALRTLGADLIVGDGDSRDQVGAVDAAVAALLAGLAAWATHALLDRLGRDRWWPFVGSTALSISMLGPAYRADGVTAMALMGLHFAVGIVLITGFAHCSRNPSQECLPTLQDTRK